MPLQTLPTLGFYDYIIVGAGSTGAVVASRLSERKDISVLLLEAGDNDLNWPEISVPVRAVFLRKTAIDWQFMTEPQQHACLDLVDRKSYWPRGKVLGGSSALNHMQYIRGSPHDYDMWASSGCTGWSYKDVLPYFIKSETDNMSSEYSDKGYHGSSGPLNVTEATTNPIGLAFVEAARELGHRIGDCNGKAQIAFSPSPATRDSGGRITTARAYIHPALQRQNFAVTVNAHATKLLFAGKRVTGVEFLKNGRAHTVFCNKEVIVSAGTICSPQLLMLSGIGPKKHLEELKIPVKSDLPVGQHLQDHVFLDGLEFYIDQPISITKAVLNSEKTQQQYRRHGTGPWSSPGANEAVGFIRTDLQDASKPYPDIQIHILCSLRNSGKDGENLMNVKPEVWKAMHGNMEDKHGFNIHTILLHPKSEGFIKLRSRNPMHKPLIDPQFLKDPNDVKVLVQGIKETYKLIQTKAMRRLGAKMTPRKLPGFERMDAQSDDYLEALCRHLTLTLYHPTGTCKMGPLWGESTVVDPTLRVIGVEGLRVADCSIMPEIISGNTNAPAIMIGEKMADILLTEIGTGQIAKL